MKRGLTFAAALVAAVLFGGVANAQVINAQTVNSSVVIVAANTFQSVLAAVVPPALRRSLTVENNNATDSCWLFVGAGTPTKGTSMLLLPGASYTRYYPYVPSDQLQATCAANSDTLYVDTQ